MVASLSDAVTQHRKLRYTGPLGAGAAYFDALWNVALTLIQSPSENCPFDGLTPVYRKKWCVPEK